ncbi:MAG: protein kinase [Planctomycetes bacterium]|nr:protein kinase [Planctomycetota bacterium]
MSGNLAEMEADRLVRHLDSCNDCQRQIDDMSRRADSLVAAIRRPVAPARDSQELARLIAKAKGARSEENTPALTSDNKVEPVALDQFVACLSKSGLSNADEIAECVRELAPTSSIEFANQLLAVGKLTLLQARALLRGRWRQLVLGNYAVLEMLGQGGMSRVYRARHLQTKREVCIKLLHPKGPRTSEHKERFAREVRTIASLEHPNIVVAHDSGQSESIPYLVMELLDGSDLAKLVAAKGPLPPDSAIRYVLQAAKALEYAHSRGVIHRDIKPHNLFLDDTGKIKVLDLGLARFDSVLQPSNEPGFSTMTKTGMVVGTVDYIAPEQAVDARDADYRSDIYSLGCTLHYLLVGRTVFSGETLMARLVAHREEPIPNLAALRPGISPEIKSVFERMVAKCPTNRYQSMTELVADLELLLAGDSPAFDWEPPVQEIYELEAVADAETHADLNALTLAAIPAPAHRPAHRPVRPASKRQEFRVPKPVLYWSCVGAGALACVVLLFVAVTSFFPEIAGTVGLSNSPRAVIVVASDGFRVSHYQAVTKALNDRAIPFVTASTRSGDAKADDGTRIKVDLTIDDYTPRSSDGVIVCGGSVHELKNTDLVDRSLKGGATVLGVGSEGFAPLYSQYHLAFKESGVEWDKKLPGGEMIQAGNGYITKACDEGGVPTMVDHVFGELVSK